MDFWGRSYNKGIYSSQGFGDNVKQVLVYGLGICFCAVGFFNALHVEAPPLPPHLSCRSFPSAMVSAVMLMVFF